jgi:hypothetical protein
MRVLFTSWTYSVRPTVPIGSGGVVEVRLLMPSKLRFGSGLCPPLRASRSSNESLRPGLPVIVPRVTTMEAWAGD